MMEVPIITDFYFSDLPYAYSGGEGSPRDVSSAVTAESRQETDFNKQAKQNSKCSPSETGQG